MPPSFQQADQYVSFITLLAKHTAHAEARGQGERWREKLMLLIESLRYKWEKNGATP